MNLAAKFIRLRTSTGLLAAASRTIQHIVVIVQLVTLHCCLITLHCVPVQKFALNEREHAAAVSWSGHVVVVEELVFPRGEDLDDPEAVWCYGIGRALEDVEDAVDRPDHVTDCQLV